MAKREDNLMEKIAAMLEKPVEEVKEQKALYTEEEAILEAQSVLNFYEWRRTLVKGPKETDRQFEARERVWRYKSCEGCKQRFAYSFHYDGVKFCSLDCLRIGLRKIGLDFSYARPLHLRWGFQYPGIVPSSALTAIEHQLQSEPSASSACSDEMSAAS